MESRAPTAAQLPAKDAAPVRTKLAQLGLQLAEAGRPATECERGQGLSALVGAPIADSARWASVSMTALSVPRLSSSVCAVPIGPRPFTATGVPGAG